MSIFRSSSNTRIKRIVSDEDLSQTMPDANQSRISGCSSFELSLESSTSAALQPVQPLPAIAINKFQHFANPQPVAISPIIRRVLSELYEKREAERDAKRDAKLDAKLEMLQQTITAQMEHPNIRKRRSLPKNDPSIDNGSIEMENTILVSQYVYLLIFQLRVYSLD